MTRLLRQSCCLFSLLLVACFAVAQSDFSADVFDNRQPDSPKAKIYAGKEKIRFESKEKDPRGGGAFIMNMATHTSVVVMDQQHMYMEMPMQMAAQRNPYFFRAEDVDDVCADWLKLEWNKGGSCHKVGSETVNGRSAVKFEGTNSKGEAGTVWMDPKLRFPVKWQGKNGGGELRNIQQTSQPSSLFEIPSGYKKFDMGNMGAMMQQQQQQ